MSTTRQSVASLEIRPNTSAMLPLLLDRDLDFHNEKSSYASHSWHPFAAKFPPQLPRAFIETLTIRGDTILDPMVGSGTTIVEACLLGRRAIGYDIDPLALKICRAKVTPLDTAEVEEVGIHVLNSAKRTVKDRKAVERFLSSLDVRTREFIDYWFLPRTQTELASLILSIQRITSEDIRNFIELVFSSVIITKSGGVSLARDLAHTRPHKDPTKTPRDALTQFEQKLAKAVRGLHALRSSRRGIRVCRGDARDLKLKDNCIDLVVTSPPYANAIDYARAHKFSLVWMGEPLSALTELRGTYIGTERTGKPETSALPRTAQAHVETLAAKDASRAKVLAKYLVDMRYVLKELFRVLKFNRAAILVVGPSTMRGLRIPTHELLTDIGESVGFTSIGCAKRALDRNRRMMPASFRRNSASGIENRMHEEFVIGFHKE